MQNVHELLLHVHDAWFAPSAARFGFPGTRQVQLSGETTIVRTENDGQASVLVRRWTRAARCVGPVRRELRRLLGEWELAELADSAEIVVSELFTNAVRHVKAPRDRLVETRYERLAGGVRIEVHDADAPWKPVPESSLEQESGRGLALVDSITGGCWGVSERDGVGKLVWAVVADDGVGEYFGARK